VRVKICGITSIQDARIALEAGADAIGVNMVAGPRRVTAEVATAIISSVGTVTDSTRDASGPCPVVLASVADGRLDDAVEQVVRQTKVRWLQLYGDVTASVIRSQVQADLKPVPVVRVADEGFAVPVNRLLAACGADRPAAVLLDAYHRDKLGGTGEPFRWSWVTDVRDRGELDGWPPIVLAGGLTPENVAQAIRTVGPWAVDVSSGVEASPGRKDPAKVDGFVRNARNALSGPRQTGLAP